MLSSSMAAFSSQYVSFPCEAFPLMLTSLTPGAQSLSSLSGLISHLGFSGLFCCTFSTQLLLFSLSHFHFLVTFPGLCPVVQPLVRKQKRGASGDWTIIFLCSGLLWSWAGGVRLTTAQAQMYWAGTASKLFKGRRSCRREKSEIWNRATWLPVKHKWTLDSVIILTRALKNNCYP